MDTAVSILYYCWKALAATGIQLLVIMGPLLALAFLMNSIAGFVERRAYQSMGRTVYLWLFGWLGTAVHELGHAVFCVIFRHRIVEIQIFKPDQKAGTLGYVKHGYNPRSIYQNAGNFFIGVGPVIFGTGCVLLLSIYLLDMDILGTALTLNTEDFGSWYGFEEILRNIWKSLSDTFNQLLSIENLSSWQFYLFIYLVFCIGSSITLSRADMRGARKGFILIIGIILGFNLLTIWAGDFATDFCIDLSSSSGAIYAAMLFVMLFNLIAALLVLAIPIMTSTFRRFAT